MNGESFGWLKMLKMQFLSRSAGKQNARRSHVSTILWRCGIASSSYSHCRYPKGFQMSSKPRVWIIEHDRQYNTLVFICNMESFIPIKKIKSKVSTVTMLSHVRFVRDLKNTILAADIVVNERGFKVYQLDVYGDME
ncbi:hypothetical protein AC579_5248 [Pseudocercospora musae]|uniref:Uncharacterized protein n=1 Tax=Pseudocercospora musae TaxID=113226 RepID=A0A139IPL9_9PEZI|nr:hypothetical protein AC579_5248 [Pseudocercospora musae]